MKTDVEILSNEIETNGNEMERINLSQKTIIDFAAVCLMRSDVLILSYNWFSAKFRSTAIPQL